MVLRTMTLKSLIGNAGNWSIKNSTVESCIKSNKQRWALIYSYFHKSHINFNDEVLDLLNIKDEFVIEKPGTNHDLYLKYRSKYDEGYDEMVKRRDERFKIFCQKKSENHTKLSKSFLRDLNRGYY